MMAAIAAFHGAEKGGTGLTARVLSYEYEVNPVPGGGMYVATSADGRILSSAGWIPHPLRGAHGEPLLSLQLERILCAADAWCTGLFDDLIRFSLEDQFPDGRLPPVLWAVTPLRRILQAHRFVWRDCLLEIERAVTLADSFAGTLEAETVAPGEITDSVALAEHVCQLGADTIRLAPSEAVLRWLIWDNPFTQAEAIRLTRGGRAVAIAVIKPLRSGLVDLDEMWVDPGGADPLQVVAALLRLVAHRGMSGLRTIVNGANGAQVRWAGRLIEEMGFRGRQARGQWIGRCEGPDAEEMVRRIEFSGLWRPPTWAGYIGPRRAPGAQRARPAPVFLEAPRERAVLSSRMKRPRQESRPP
jgi:hypothetical protein